MWEQQELFDVEHFIAINSYEEQPKPEKPQYKAVPRSQETTLPYYDNPVNDNEWMFNYQHDWLVHDDFEARQKLFEMGYKVTRRLLWRKMKRGGLGYLDEEQQNDIVSNAFIYVFRRFDYGYCVTKNFFTVLNDGLRHALFYKTMANMETSLDAIKGDYTAKIERFF